MAKTPKNRSRPAGFLFRFTKIFQSLEMNNLEDREAKKAHRERIYQLSYGKGPWLFRV